LSSNDYVLFRLLYKSNLSGLGYGSLEPLVIVLVLGFFDSMKKVYSIQNNNNKKKSTFNNNNKKIINHIKSSNINWKGYNEFIELENN